MKHLFTKRGWIYIALGVIAAYSLANIFYTRFDLTDNKKYSFTTATHLLLNNLQDKVSIQVFLVGGVKSSDKKLSNAIKESLEEYRALSNGKISFEFINPFDESIQESDRNKLLDTLMRLGLQPYTLQAQTKSAAEVKQRVIIPGLIVKVGNRVKAINLFQGLQLGNEDQLFYQALLMLEYRISSAINELTMIHPHRIEYLIGHNEPLDIRMAEFFSILGSKYKVDTLNLSNQSRIPEGTDVFIVFSPYKALTDDEKIKIDQFIMNGGKALFVLNTMEVDDSKKTTSGNLLFINQDVNLDDMMFRYGVRLNYSLVKDLQCATISVVVGEVSNKPQIEPIQWPYYPILNTNPNHVITKGLDPILAKYSTFLDTIAVPNTKKTILASTSSQTQLVAAPAMVSINEATLLDHKFYQHQFLPVITLLEGRFPSLYYNRMIDQDRENLEKLTGQAFPKISQPTSIIVVANPALFFNEISQQKIIPMGLAKDMNYMFANQSLLLNMVEYLINKNGLIAARNKNFTMYLLDNSKVDNERLLWQFINIILPIVLLIIIGIVFIAIRNKKSQ